MNKINFKLPKTFDWMLFIIPVLLILISVSVIYSLTYYNNQIYLFHNQILFSLIGIVLMVVLTFVDYRNYKNLSWIFYLIGIILLIIVLFWGKTIFGSKRWIDLIIFDLQPSEFMKIFLIFVLSSLFADKVGDVSLQRIIFGFILIFIPVFLVLRQPDLGSAIILMVIGFAIILYSKLSTKQIVSIILILVTLLPLTWFVLKDYQKERLFTFLNPTKDRFGAGYNVIQSTITVGSGGLFGKGFGHGPQSQLNFLPVAHTDFIFSGFAEAVGFLGSIVLIIIFAILIYRVINVAKISKDHFGMLVAVGIAAMLIFQVFINIGMNLGIMPVTGITLPFVSYGGSSMILNLCCIGILQSIYLRHKKITF